MYDMHRLRQLTTAAADPSVPVTEGFSAPVSRRAQLQHCEFNQSMGKS